ncbi:MAG: nitrate reductase subunit beta [Bacteroidales bacterium]|nr:nitrate reductase subunit beta [Lentimicrobiaceae bacterium]MDD5695805.1 nitrate reductase subunit beta [Bacteroidales bacterium]
MKIQAQIAMVLNLDKCIGCHTCSVTCKNVWTTRRGMEYAWFNNVETKPGRGYPTDWEKQDKWKGGWILRGSRLRPRMGGRAGIMKNIFSNPYLPQIDDYYEPFTFNYSILHSRATLPTPPSARPYSMITGRPMEKINKGPNWEDDLGGAFEERSREENFGDIDKEIYRKFENAFMIYLPRLCEHCLNPACVAACPSGAIYKREDDGVVLIDQDRCRGWRQCVSACPYKKIYFNWQSKRSEKCTLCYPRIDNGEPTICSETCVGRIRYIGVMLYNADNIKMAASSGNPADLYTSMLDVFLDPNNPGIIAEAARQGIPDNFLTAAKRSPVYKMAVDWRVAFPLHPEYRTLPMVWYTPPLSPIQEGIESGKTGMNGIIPDVGMLRIPVKYLANMFTAGQEEPVRDALVKMLAMRAFMRIKTIENRVDEPVLTGTGLTPAIVEEMYRYMAIADLGDRFVIPVSHREYAFDAFGDKSACGFNGNENCGSMEGRLKNLFGGM